MKYGQSWEVFKKKTYAKYCQEPSTRPFYKKSKLSISLNQQSEILCNLFLFYAQGEVYPSSKVSTTCFDLVSLPHFRQDFWRKIFLTLYFIDWPNFIAWLPLVLETLVNKCSVIICLPVCEVIISKINLNFSSRFPAWPKR